MIKRFLVSVAIAIFLCGTMRAEEGFTWYVLDSYQIDSFLVGVGGKEFNTKALWENVKAQDVATEIGKKVDNFFIKLAENTKETVAKDASLRLMFEGLGFIPYKHDDKFFNALLLDKYTFLNEFRSNEKYAVAEVIMPGEKGFLCADLYRSIGKLIASYFNETLERVKIHEKCAFEHPVMHIFVKQMKDGSLKMRSLPRGRQEIYKGYDTALSGFLDAQKDSSWLSKIGKGALCFLGLYGLSEAALSKLPTAVKDNVIRGMNSVCNRMPTAGLQDYCYTIIPSSDIISDPECQKPVDGTTSAMCKALTGIKEYKNEIENLKNQLEEKGASLITCEKNLEKAHSEKSNLGMKHKGVLGEKDQEIEKYKNDVKNLGESYKTLNTTLVDCQNGLKICKQDLKSITDSSGNCSISAQIAQKKVEGLSSKLKISKEGMEKLKVGINALNEKLAEHLPITEVTCKKNGTVLCDLIHMKNDLGKKTTELLADIVTINNTICNLN
jgi:hypothetical protein